MNAAIKAHSLGVDAPELSEALHDLSLVMVDAITILKSMRVHCHPVTFYHGVRKYFAGSLNDPLLPNGVFVAGQWEKLPGASAAQSTFT